MPYFSQHPDGLTGENSAIARDPSSFNPFTANENNNMNAHDMSPGVPPAYSDISTGCPPAYSAEPSELAPLNHIALNHIGLNHIALNQLCTPSLLPFQQQPANATLCQGPCQTMIDPATSPWCDACHPPTACARIGCANTITLIEGLEAEICMTCRGLKKCAGAGCFHVLPAAAPAALCESCRGVVAYCATRGCESVVPAVAREAGWVYCQLCSKPCAEMGCAGQTTAGGTYCTVCTRVANDLAEYINSQQHQTQTPPDFDSQGVNTMTASVELFFQKQTTPPQQEQEQEQPTPPNFVSQGQNLMGRDELFLQSGYTTIAEPEPMNTMNDGSVLSTLDSEMTNDESFHVAAPTELNFLLQPLIPQSALAEPESDVPISTPVESESNVLVTSPQCERCSCSYSAEDFTTLCTRCKFREMVVPTDDDFEAEPPNPKYPFM
ncbi:hypothetical protein KJ359_005034 [Pestalotiopsis sp. 9143b]|nr:hypothetical protein KJ359_005034 [Pestalotiopsis sp. 9143b]